MNHPNQIRRARGRLRTTQVPATLCGLGGGVRNWPLLGSGGIDPSALKGRAKAPSNATARHHPGGSFAFVMATGIVVIAVASQGLSSIGESLFAVNLVAFAGLSSLMLLRLIGDRAAVIAELSHHRIAAGFLTIVASLAVL